MGFEAGEGLAMGLEIEGFDPKALSKQFNDFQSSTKNRAADIVNTVAAGMQRYVRGQYQVKVYQSPIAAFGYPRSRSKALSQSVEIDFKPKELLAIVFTNKQNAKYVEFGTGIYSTVGKKARIKAKSGKALAFPVYRLPNGFKGLFIKKGKAKKLPSGAIGLVIAKSVRGMKPRPIWTAKETQSFMNKLMAIESKRLT